MNTHYTCKDCQQTKAIEQFPTYPVKGRQYHRKHCRECWNKHKRIAMRRYSSTEKGQRSAKNSNLSRYGITIEEYEQLEAEQNYLCAICKKPNTAKRKLHVDHCHKTGRIRGLLCHHCNTAIGHMFESSEIMQRAIEYLKEIT